MSGLLASAFQRRISANSRQTLCGVIDSSNDHPDLNPDDIIVVSLCDITLWDWARMDFPHLSQQNVIANVQFDNCNYFPILFTLYYNAEEIDINLCYGLRCVILDKNKRMKYSSEGFVDVLTGKHPKTNVNITVVPSNIPSTSTIND